MSDQAKSTKTAKELRQAIRQLLTEANTSLSLGEIATRCGANLNTVAWLLGTMVQRGELIKRGRGQYALPDNPSQRNTRARIRQTLSEADSPLSPKHVAERLGANPNAVKRAGFLVPMRVDQYQKSALFWYRR